MRERGCEFIRNNRGQVTIFIIIAIVILAAIGIYFAVRTTTISTQNVPQNLEPVYDIFSSCLENDALVGIDLLESHAGYIELPAFESGSDYMPFSNQLDFAGAGIPYWHYVSANGVSKEQVPSKIQMQEQLAKFIENRITSCNLNDFYSQGFEVVMNSSEKKVDVSITGTSVSVNLKMPVKFTYNGENAVVTNHKVSIKSNLGSLYDSAKKIYNKENKEMFLEAHGIDVLRLYAPVDGFEVTCSPKIWKISDILSELQSSVESNTLALRGSGNDYTLKNKENKYFVLNLGVTEDVRFINSRNWPYSFEVNPSEGELLLASPVGNQAGLGMLGFCYVPYHFVYDYKYPVLVQVSSGEETFQFPIGVVINKNAPREPYEGEAAQSSVSEVCNYKTIPFSVRTYDVQRNPVNAKVSYECLGAQCDLGETKSGVLEDFIPKCVNGYIVAKAEGYKTVKQILPSAVSSADLFMDKTYKLNVELKLSNVNYNGSAIVNFISENEVKTIAYPQQKEIELSQGDYLVKLQVYENSNINIQATKKQQCVQIPQEGFGALFGLTREKCYDIEYPAQTISNVLVAGGNQEQFILESDLQNSKTIVVNAQRLSTPKSLDELQKNYLSIDEKGLDINFK